MSDAPPHSCGLPRGSSASSSIASTGCVFLFLLLAVSLLTPSPMPQCTVCHDSGKERPAGWACTFAAKQGSNVWRCDVCERARQHCKGALAYSLLPSSYLLTVDSGRELWKALPEDGAVYRAIAKQLEEHPGAEFCVVTSPTGDLKQIFQGSVEDAIASPNVIPLTPAEYNTSPEPATKATKGKGIAKAKPKPKARSRGGKARGSMGPPDQIPDSSRMDVDEDDDDEGEEDEEERRPLKRRKLFAIQSLVLAWQSDVCWAERASEEGSPALTRAASGASTSSVVSSRLTRSTRDKTGARAASSLPSPAASSRVSVTVGSAALPPARSLFAPRSTARTRLDWHRSVRDFTYAQLPRTFDTASILAHLGGQSTDDLARQLAFAFAGDAANSLRQLDSQLTLLMAQRSTVAAQAIAAMTAVVGDGYTGPLPGDDSPFSFAFPPGPSTE